MEKGTSLTSNPYLSCPQSLIDGAAAGAEAFFLQEHTAVAADVFASGVTEVAPESQRHINDQKQISHIIHRGDGEDDVVDGTNASQSQQIWHGILEGEMA